MKTSAVIVHFHAPGDVEGAVSSLRRDAAQAGIELEILVVDNGSTTTERVRLERIGVTVLGPSGNRGYASALNAGVAASSGDALVLANADIEVLPGCLAGLLAGLEKTDVVGPRLVLDHAGSWLQPPADRRTLGAEIAMVAARSGFAVARARRRWRRRAHRFWRADRLHPMRQLSGALLAARRETWAASGGFDEAYRLYFEETDWLMRLARDGRRVALAPAARAVHLWGRSTRLEPRAAAWFEVSAARFRRRWYGGLGAAFLARLHHALAPRRVPTPAGLEAAMPPVEGCAWLELAHDLLGLPATGNRVTPGQETVPEPPPSLREGRYVLRGVGHGGNDRWARWLPPGGGSE